MNLFLNFFLFLCFVFGFVSHINAFVEIDVSWDFNESPDLFKSGWANSSAELIDMEAKVEAGELRCSILGYKPKLDSPSLFLNVSNRHYVVMRASYQGSAEEAKLLLRSGSSITSQAQTHQLTQTWSSPTTMDILDAPAPLNSNHTVNNLVDNNIYSSYIFNQSVGQLIFDLKSFRKVNTLKIIPLEGTYSPKRCVLMKSMTNSGPGPFEKVFAFTIQPTKHSYNTTTYANDTIITASTEEQIFSGFEGSGRYWKLFILDNYGSHSTGIREISFLGYDEAVSIVPFALENSGDYKMYYLPINQYLYGYLLRMRFELIYPSNIQIEPYKHTQIFREELSIDYIRVIRAPEIWKVRGCLDKYYESANYQNPMYNITNHLHMINNHLPIYSYTKNNLSYQFATTYDCPLEGGTTISIEGLNFGSNPAVYIDNKLCPLQGNFVSSTEGRVQQLLCTLPAGSPGVKHVRIENGLHPGLFFDIPSLTYRVAPPVISRPNVTNIGAMRVDLVWNPPDDDFSRMTVTGYKILWFKPDNPSFKSNCTVGNVTTTSIRGLQPATEYVFAIAAIAEGHENAILPTDLYGRRDPLSNAMIGEFSIYTNVTGTIQYDFDFGFFNANLTLNNSGSTSSNSNGPTGQYGSEGNYGLVLVGSANIENCNVSSTCCDGYDASIGVSSCGNYKSVCSVLPAHMLPYSKVINGITRRSVPSNLDYPNGAPAEISITTLSDLIANKGADLPSSACGSALRLTAAQARASGAAWYRRKMNVREGFDTFIKFQISNPSQKCDRLDDVNTFCRSRGADGLAFVIQNVAPDALGLAGSGLGYDGIFNSLAVELDTYHNYDQMDFYENHISVNTQGFRYNITANHSRSLAVTNNIPDLTDGMHTIRIKYDPTFDPNSILHPSFQVTGYTTWFLNNADYQYGGEGDWGAGFGLLYIYLDDLYSPVITTPINLGATLDLDDGRAYIGMTASTGDQYWQAHDIIQWQFTSLFIDEEYHPPLRVNNDGAYTCVNEAVCVHNVDYDHYTRKNNIWGGTFYPNTEGWMDPTVEGFCTSC